VLALASPLFLGDGLSTTLAWSSPGGVYLPVEALLPEPFSLGFILACPEDIPADIPIKFPEDFLKDCPLRPWACPATTGHQRAKVHCCKESSGDVRSLPEM